ncbi:MAG TPA: MarR family winged helix-turn-helix transcriptional regulator [Streptosporangiaceae bacterium]|jgi:DNA-binding MarR family transcriptional regulator
MSADDHTAPGPAAGDSAAEDYYDVWVDMVARMSRPRFRELILDRAGVSLEPDLAQYLVTVDLRGPIGVLDLAGLLDANHPKASRSLARLERLGLVARAADRRDRRVKTASVTPEGHRVVAAINAGRRRILDEALAGWSEHDRAALARLTRRFSDAIFALVEALGTEHGAPPPAAAEPPRHGG